MPRITSPKGLAINNRGFITLSFLRLLIAFGYWKRGRGSEPGIRSLSKPEPKSMPPLECGPAFYLLRAITALENAITFRINVTSLGKDCCPIVNSFEKKFILKKDLIARLGLSINPRVP